MKKQLAIIGACCSRDMCNSIFVENWREHFDLVYYSFQTSFISLVSSPIPYARKLLDFEGKRYSLWYKNIFERELNKTFCNDLLSLKPDNLLIDFYSDVVMGVLEIEGCSYLTQRLKDQRNIAAFLLLNVTKRLDPVTSHDAYMALWKNSMDEFLLFMHQFLPNTKIILNIPHFTNRILYADGTTGDYGEKKVDLYNQIYTEMVSWISTTAPEVIPLDLRRDYEIDPDYVWGGMWIVHYHKQYYRDLIVALDKLCITPPERSVASPESDRNLLVNGDFRYGTLFYRRFDERFFITKEDGHNILSIRQEGNETELYAQSWSLNIPFVENEPYTICFDCRVSSQVALSNRTIAVIRTFDREEGITKKDSIEQIIIPFDEKGFDRWSHYSVTVQLKGKYISVGMYCTKNGYISWRNIRMYHRSSEPITPKENVIEKLLLSGKELLDVNQLHIFQS